MNRKYHSIILKIDYNVLTKQGEIQPKGAKTIHKRTSTGFIDNRHLLPSSADMGEGSL